jgi:hypothetical protein
MVALVKVKVYYVGYVIVIQLYQGADKPDGFAVESCPGYLGCAPVCGAAQCQIKRQLVKIQIHRLPRYVTLHYTK